MQHLLIVEVHHCLFESPRLGSSESLTLLELQSHFGNKPPESQVVCPQNGTAVLKGLINPFRIPVPFWGHASQIPSSLFPNCPQNGTAVLEGLINPLRTPVPFWGHTSQIPTNLFPTCPRNGTAVLKGLIKAPKK